jgi:hypothetical protein
MRSLLPIAVLLAALSGLASSCGRASSPPARSPVRLTIGAPDDEAVVRQSTVRVRGTVAPSTATVLVRGERAAVTGGRFTATISLRAGINVVDVVASAGRGARPALAAVRIRRQITVEVPDVSGEAVDAAQRDLEAAGLVADVQDTSDLLDDLIGGDRSVCDTEPTAGDTVDAGSTVAIYVGRRC